MALKAGIAAWPKAFAPLDGQRVGWVRLGWPGLVGSGRLQCQP